MPATTRTQAVSPGYIYTVTASLEAIVRDVETDKLLCKANNGSQGMFVAIGGTVSITTSDPTATITQASTSSGGARFEVHQTRPDTGEEGVIYLIPITSSTEEENEYEEWIWVKGEWERLGTTGVNLSNYATLTGANTYSGDNTFNGLLLKSNSSSLGDTSVLNRFEADARYGRLDANNTWSGEQYISADGRLTLHPDATIVAHNIQGTTDITWLSFNGLHLVGIADIEASDVKTPIVTTNVLYTSNITTNAANKWLAIEAEHIDVEDADISGVRTLQAADIISGSTLYAHTIAAIDQTNYKINLSEVYELQFKNISGGATLSGVQALAYNGRTIDLNYNNWNTIAINSNKILFPTPGVYLGLNQGVISSVRELSYSDNTINLAYSENAIAINSDKLLLPNQGSVIELNQGIISGVSSLNSDNTKLILNDTSNLGRTTLSNDLELASSNNRLFVGHISGVQTLRNANVSLNFDPSFGGRIRVGDAGVPLEVTQLSGVQSLQCADIIVTFDPDSNPARIHINPSTSLEVTQVSGVKILRNFGVEIRCDDKSVAHGNAAMLVCATEGIKVTDSIISSSPSVTISPSKIEAFRLNASSFGSDTVKYGLRITPDSCQLYGIDFAYGDVWSSYLGEHVFLASDTVKIMKPALTLDTTGVASLAFGGAPKVLFRTFPNGGETAIFEFQSGYWSDDSHSAIETGMVDLRKPSFNTTTTTLHKNSLITKGELDGLIFVKTTSDDGKIAIGSFAEADAMHAIAIGKADVTEDGEKSIAIGFDAYNASEGSVVIGPAAHNFNIDSVVIGARAGGENEMVTAVGPDATSRGERAVSVGQAALSTEFGAVAIGVWTQAIAEGAVAIGVLANSENIAIGCHASASADGLAIGAYAEAEVGELNITVGGGPDSNHAGARCSMLLYGGTSYATRDTTGYLTFEVGNTSYSDREESGALNDTITISKPNLWSALDRAKYRGAQPYASYATSAVSNIPALEPNSITHIYTAINAAIDLSNITLAQHDTAVTTAELWVEVTSAGATITWPDDMLWPDEADPTTAPSFSGPEESTEVGYTAQRLYCVTLRTQPTINIATGNAGIPLLIATIAYTLDHKVASASS